MTTQYSTAQKLSLAGMVVGGVLCAVGGCAPFWLVTDVQGPGFLSMVNKVASASMNPFLYCREILGESRCYFINMDVKVEWLQSVRITTVVCVLVGVLCGLSSLCLACCSCCRRFIVLGILAFFGAGSGIFSCVVFSQNTDIFTTSILGVQVFSLGWAFYVFCAGVGVLGLVSFVACFSSPDNMNAVHGMVMSRPPPQNPTQLTIISPPAHQYPHMNAHPHSVPVGAINPSVNPGVKVIDMTEP